MIWKEERADAPGLMIAWLVEAAEPLGWGTVGREGRTPGAQPGTLTLVQDGVLSPRSCKVAPAIRGVGRSDLGAVHGVATRCRGIE